MTASHPDGFAAVASPADAATHPVSRRVVGAYAARTPGSAALHGRARSSLPGGDTRTVVFFEPHPLYVDRALGAVMVDVDGHEYLDFLGNYTSLVHGHAHPEIVRAITEQAARGTAHAAGSEPSLALAEEIRRRVPSMQRLRFCNSGTEAVLNAVRAARAHTGRHRVLKFEGGYHGSADVAEVSVDPDPAAAGPARRPLSILEEPGIPPSVADDVIVAPYNDAGACAEILAEHGGSVAAVLVEPMLGAAGAIPADPAFLRALRRLCDETGALLVFDEVITFRLAEGGAQELHGVRPDLTTLGKIIGGGLPVGAFGGREDVMRLFAPPGNVLVQSGTFNANAVTMAAGLTALRLLTGAEIDRIDDLGERLAEGLSRALIGAGLRGAVTGIGSIRTLHLTDGDVVDYRSKASGRPDLTGLLHLGLLNRGVFIAPRGMFVTSTAMGAAEVDRCVEATAEALVELRPVVEAVAPHLVAGGDISPGR